MKALGHSQRQQRGQWQAAGAGEPAVLAGKPQAENGGVEQQRLGGAVPPAHPAGQKHHGQGQNQPGVGGDAAHCVADGQLRLPLRCRHGGHQQLRQGGGQADHCGPNEKLRHSAGGRHPAGGVHKQIAALYGEHQTK